MQLRVDFELLDKITAGYHLNHEICGMSVSLCGLARASIAQLIKPRLNVKHAFKAMKFRRQAELTKLPV